MWHSLIIGQLFYRSRICILIKVSFSEKATKYDKISIFFTLLINVKNKMAFSERMNFIQRFHDTVWKFCHYIVLKITFMFINFSIWILQCTESLFFLSMKTLKITLKSRTLKKNWRFFLVLAWLPKRHISGINISFISLIQ